MTFSQVVPALLFVAASAAPLLADPYTYTLLPTAQPALSGFTVPTGINNSGEIVGYFSAESVTSGFTFVNGTYTNLNFPGTPLVLQSHAFGGTMINGLNNSGVLVGGAVGSNN